MAEECFFSPEIKGEGPTVVGWQYTVGCLSVGGIQLKFNIFHYDGYYAKRRLLLKLLSLRCSKINNSIHHYVSVVDANFFNFRQNVDKNPFPAENCCIEFHFLFLIRIQSVVKCNFAHSNWL